MADGTEKAADTAPEDTECTAEVPEKDSARAGLTAPAESGMGLIGPQRWPSSCLCRKALFQESTVLLLVSLLATMETPVVST